MMVYSLQSTYVLSITLRELKFNILGGKKLKKLSFYCRIFVIMYEMLKTLKFFAGSKLLQDRKNLRNLKVVKNFSKFEIYI